MILGHKIRLKPYPEARIYFAQASGVARHAYNWGLARWKERYTLGENPTPFSLKKEYNSLKRTEFPWALEVTKCASEQAFADLGKAFGNFFRRVKQGKEAVGYPKFKKKGRCVDGFYLSNDQFKLDEIDGIPHIRIPKLGWVRMTERFRFDGKIMGARISKRGNHWFVSIQADVEVDTDRWNGLDPIGIDMGIQSLLVCSDGQIAENQRVLTHHLDRLRRLNKKLSRQVKGSNNWWKTVNKLQRLHERVANIRRDYHHKWTSFIAANYGIIGIEDLAVSNMIKNRRLARHIADAGWRQIR